MSIRTSPILCRSPSKAPVGNVVVLGQATPAARPIRRPLFLSRIPAGFPSPADEYIETKLSLDEHLIQHEAATFFLRVKGDSMINAGIHDGDLLIVDRALTPQDGNIVIAVLDGELTLKRLLLRDPEIILMPENPKYPPITLNAERDLTLWGVVTNVVHSLR